jgi:hypothetical protein
MVGIKDKVQEDLRERERDRGVGEGSRE